MGDLEFSGRALTVGVRREISLGNSTRFPKEGARSDQTRQRSASLAARHAMLYAKDEKHTPRAIAPRSQYHLQRELVPSQRYLHPVLEKVRSDDRIRQQRGIVVGAFLPRPSPFEVLLSRPSLPSRSELPPIRS